LRKINISPVPALCEIDPSDRGGVFTRPVSGKGGRGKTKSEGAWETGGLGPFCRENVS